MSKIHEMFYTDLFRAISERAIEYGYKVLVYNSFSDLYASDPYDEGEKAIFSRIRYDVLDGLIILGETIKNQEVLDSIVENARKHDVYTVSIDKHIDGCYNVEYNYRSSFEAIVRHVVEKHGCRTINVVAGFKGNSFSEERINCCRRVLEEHGLELVPERILYGDFWSEPTERAFDEFMKSKYTMPDAFICCNDTMAITICSKLTEYGFSVPRDVIVTGFDGIFEEQFNIPRLTTARQNLELAGENAVDAVISHNSGRVTGNLSMIDHKVIWSHSCGCKPIDYREATGKIMELFHMADSDNSYDTNMADFNSAAAAAEGIDSVSEAVLQYSNTYGYYYYAMSLKEDFMNISDDYEDFIFSGKADSSENRLILCERLFDERFEPYVDTDLRHFEEAADKINIFLLWSVHFQDKAVGTGVMGLSTGADGMYANDDTRHLLKYTRHLNSVLETVNSQSVLKKVIAKLQDLYIRDHTGLYNRRGFYTEIGRFVSHALLKKDTVSYLIIISADMDGLKTINDTYGHAEGDVAIRTYAEALRSIWDKNCICSRFGGDEFIVACISDDDPVKAGNDIINKITAFLDDFNNNSGKPYKVSGSIGVHSEIISSDMKLDDIIKAADQLMYKEKSTHKRSRYRSGKQSQQAQQTQQTQQVTADTE